jgi:hypothetical protein
MTAIMSREIRLASRPHGFPSAGNFTLAETVLRPLQDQEVLVRNLFMSVDRYRRGRKPLPSADFPASPRVLKEYFRLG